MQSQGLPSSIFGDSGTSFASRKLPFRDLLLLVAHYANALKGISAIRLRQELEVSYKSAFVRLHKLREVLEARQQANDIRGAVEIDGAYFGGYVKPQNDRPKRVDRRRLTHRSGKRQCVVIFRERHGRSRPIVCSENEASRIARTVVDAGSVIYTDENTDWNRLAAHYVLHMVHRSERYWATTSYDKAAESYLGFVTLASVKLWLPFVHEA